ncbi:MAG: DegQ family serine endoprotease [Burkholderiales bacterium]
MKITPVYRSFLLAFAFVTAVAAGPARAQGRDLPDFTDLVEKAGGAVVNISTTQSRPRMLPQLPQGPDIGEEDLYEFFRRFIPQPPGPGQRPLPPGPRQFEQQSLGSGFVISGDGYILTNAHVVDGAEEITVRFTDKREYKAKVVGTDRRTDVALIKVEANGLPTVRFGDPSKLRVGEWVVAIGSPFGFDNTVTAGIVSAKGRSLPQENFVPFIQTDVAINPGNSGGPLFNMRGEVVGINSQIYSRTGGFMGLSFAIPIDVAMDVQQQLRTAGRVSRGRIGVVIQEVSKELAESFGLPRPAGALVSQVEKSGPAEKAGVEPGDIIVKFDGKAVNASSDLPRMVGGTRPGTKSTLQVWRKGATRDLVVTVAELPDDRVAQRDQRSKPNGKPEATPNRFGFAVSDLSEERRKQANVAGGVVVDDVRPNVRAELRPGDIILSLIAKGQTTEVRSADQFNKLIAALDKAATVTLQVRRGETSLFVTIRGE